MHAERKGIVCHICMGGTVCVCEHLYISYIKLHIHIYVYIQQERVLCLCDQCSLSWLISMYICRERGREVTEQVTLPSMCKDICIYAYICVCGFIARDK